MSIFVPLMVKYTIAYDFELVKKTPYFVVYLRQSIFYRLLISEKTAPAWIMVKKIEAPNTKSL